MAIYVSPNGNHHARRSVGSCGTNAQSLQQNVETWETSSRASWINSPAVRNKRVVVIGMVGFTASLKGFVKTSPSNDIIGVCISTENDLNLAATELLLPRKDRLGREKQPLQRAGKAEIRTLQTLLKMFLTQTTLIFYIVKKRNTKPT